MRRLVVVVMAGLMAGCATFPEAPPGVSRECARECRHEWNQCMYAEGAQSSTPLYCNKLLKECYRMCLP
jgi:hypothetical protein